MKIKSNIDQIFIVTGQDPLGILYFTNQTFLALFQIRMCWELCEMGW